LTETLDQAAIDRELKSLPGWKGAPSGLQRTFQFASFPAAIDFMRGCAAEIDRLNHHPEWTNVYNKVTVQLRTHDAGDRVTAKDAELAMLLQRAAAAQGAK
jgi:4a-hydroxytetrahydrobiopterin dehydratase